ncbi:class I SAM-dependent methyltransferase [Parafrankia elaeagni]|uniref:class I SAM-dependent methyltransferase n=1 Tax=Parafrankia elaeagni TaxID=222534 RepID=UPI00039C4363|nr:class I SAM-dependent methyltransferase [Parafrankia elaeagni]
MTMGKVSAAELDEVSSTLLTPLYGRAYGQRFAPKARFTDPMAAQLLQAVAFDDSRVLSDRSNSGGTIWRSLVLDRLTVAFARRHDRPAIVTVGVGLCTRLYRLAGQVPDSASWVGIDSPEVIDIRRRLLPDEPMTLGAASATEPGWLDTFDLAGRPVLLIAEGVIMYFGAAGLRIFLTEALRAGSGTELVADYFHPRIAHSDRHPIVKATGARFRSGARDGAALAHLVPGWALVDEHPAMERISPAHRLAATAFRLASLGGRPYAVAHLRAAP